MARNFTHAFEPAAMIPPTSAGATPSTIPTTERPAVSFDPDTDQAVILEGIVPDEYAGTGTLKLALEACGNTVTAADDARIDVVTEFRTPGAAEAMNADNFDGTADSGTFTFSTTAYSLQQLIITLTPATTPAKGDKYRIKITRDANHATLDSLAAALLLSGAEFYEEA